MEHKYKKIICILFIIFIFTLTLIAKDVYLSPADFETTNILYAKDKAPYVTISSASSAKVRWRLTHLCYADFAINAYTADIQEIFTKKTEKNPNTVLNFFGASINFPNIKNKTISMNLFTGFYDRLGSDSILQEHLKTAMPEPAFRKNYPASAFRPPNSVEGLGFSVYGAGISGIYSAFYSYWNERLGNDFKFIIDGRLGGSFSFVNLDFFGEAAIPQKITNTELKTGITMLFFTDSYYEFFAEIGLNKIPVTYFSVNNFISNFYASFEARIKKGIFNTNIACFTAPVFNLPVGVSDKTKDMHFIGFSYMMSFGNITVSRMEGGLSLLACINPQQPAIITPFSFSISPSFTFRIDRAEIDLRLPINPLMYNDLKQMFAGQVSVKAVF